jgi:hypothetical protein
MKTSAMNKCGYRLRLELLEVLWQAGSQQEEAYWLQGPQQLQEKSAFNLLLLQSEEQLVVEFQMLQTVH